MYTIRTPSVHDAYTISIGFRVALGWLWGGFGIALGGFRWICPGPPQWMFLLGLCHFGTTSVHCKPRRMRRGRGDRAFVGEPVEGATTSACCSCGACLRLWQGWPVVELGDLASQPRHPSLDRFPGANGLWCEASSGHGAAFPAKKDFDESLIEMRKSALMSPCKGGPWETHPCIRLGTAPCVSK
jgi:hypothetical protein